MRQQPAMAPTSHSPEARITAAVASRDRVWVDSLAGSLDRLGIDVRTLVPGAGAGSLTGVDVLILDSDSLTGADMAWIDDLHDTQPLVEVLAIAGDSSVADAVRALRAGAFTVLQHPVADTSLADALVAAGRRHRHARTRLAALNGHTGGLKPDDRQPDRKGGR